MLTTLFIIVCLVEALLVIAFMATEKIGYSFISFLVFLAITHFGLTGTQVDLIQAVLADIPRALNWFGIYLFLGAVYSVLRWYFRVRRTAKKMAKVNTNLQAAKEKVRSVQEKVAAGNPERGGHRPEFSGDEGPEVRHLQTEMDNLRTSLIPSRHKSLLAGWIAFFPLDAIAFIVEEPVQRIVRLLGSTYSRISKAALESQGLADEAAKIDED